jgi:uncharacterized protein (TIGR02246 family)
MRRGRADIEQEWSNILPPLPTGLTNTILIEHVQPVTRDVMVVDATGNFAGGHDARGAPIPRSSDRATYVLARRDGRWALASFRVYDAQLTPDVASGLRSARDRFVNAWRRGDAKGAASVFAADAINMIPGAPDNRGREEIERAFADFLGGVTMDDITFTPEETNVEQYRAYERGTFVQRYRPRNADSVTQSGRYMAVWRREPGGDWQYHRFLFNWLPERR